MKRRVFVGNITAATASVFLCPLTLTTCSDTKLLLKKNQRVGCIGDSITYAQGKGYPELLQSFYDKECPEYHLKFINLGLNSETIIGLTEEGRPGPRPFLFDRLAALLKENRLDVALFVMV